MKRRILLVDDNEDFLDSTLDVLEEVGYEVITANNGEDAVRKVDSIFFDVVLMDIKMPGLNGVESFLEMREKNPDVKVILCTAYPLEHLTEQARQQGVKAILTKPLRMTKLLATLDEAVKSERGACVLVVDDDVVLCDSLTDVLCAAGFRVAVANDGKKAVSVADHESPDILLLDMNLPPLNGLEVYRNVKKRHPNMVTIIMTGYSEEMQDLIDQTMNENAYVCLRKPLDMEQLLHLLKKAYDGRKNGLYEKTLRQ